MVVQPVLAKEGGQFLTRMYAIERRALREGLSGEALKVRREALIGPIVIELRAWLDKHATLLPSDLLGKGIHYYIKHFDDLTRFLRNPDLPIDNNPSERAFQDHAKLRLNALFAGSPEGGRRWAVLLGIVTTAKRHGLDVQSYLTWMFERRGTWRKRLGLTAAELTPAAYKQLIEQQKGQLAAGQLRSSFHPTNLRGPLSKGLRGLLMGHCAAAARTVRLLPAVASGHLVDSETEPQPALITREDLGVLRGVFFHRASVQHGTWLQPSPFPPIRSAVETADWHFDGCRNLVQRPEPLRNAPLIGHA